MRQSASVLYVLRNMRPTPVSAAVFTDWWQFHEQETVVESTTVMINAGEYEIITRFTGIGLSCWRTYQIPGFLQKTQELGRYKSLGAAKMGHRAVLDHLLDAGAMIMNQDDEDDCGF